MRTTAKGIALLLAALMLLTGCTARKDEKREDASAVSASEPQTVLDTVADGGEEEIMLPFDAFDTPEQATAPVPAFHKKNLEAEGRRGSPCWIKA